LDRDCVLRDFTAPDLISWFDLPWKDAVYGLPCLHNIISAVGGRLTIVAGPGLTSLPSPEDRCVLRVVWTCPFLPTTMTCGSSACWKYEIGWPFNLIVHSELVWPIYSPSSPISSTPCTVKMNCVLVSPKIDYFAQSEERSLELLYTAFKSKMGCPTWRQPCMFDTLRKVQAMLSISLSATVSRIDTPQSERVQTCLNLNVWPWVLLLTSSSLARIYMPGFNTCIIKTVLQRWIILYSMSRVMRWMLLFL